MLMAPFYRGKGNVADIKGNILLVAAPFDDVALPLVEWSHPNADV